MLSNFKEKRNFTRFGLRTPVRYQIRGQPQFDNTISNDISLGGISFTSNGFIPLQTPVMLEVNILSKVLKAIGKIAWAQPIPHSYRNVMGLEFVELPHEERAVLSNYLNTKL
ncbi:MAG: PilZ domain-containing protein [Candidatus Omnitrophota bacterium]